MIAAKLDNAIEKQLVERLKAGTVSTFSKFMLYIVNKKLMVYFLQYGDIYNFPQYVFDKALDKEQVEEVEDEEDDEASENENEVEIEKEIEREMETEYVEEQSGNSDSDSDVDVSEGESIQESDLDIEVSILLTFQWLY